MNKLTGLLLLAIGFVFMVGNAEAASSRGGSRGAFMYNYSTAMSTITVGPSAIYQVVLSSGASAEYLALYDAASVGSLTSASTGTSFRGRIFYSSTTANTVVTFDPPVQFNRGLIVGGSAVTGSAMVIFESGRPRE